MDNFKKVIAALTAITTIATSAMSIASTTLSASAATVGSYISTTKKGDVIKVDINLNSEIYLSSFTVGITVSDGFSFYGNKANASSPLGQCITSINGNTLSITNASNSDVKVKNGVISFSIKTKDNLNSTNNKITYNVVLATSSSGDVQIAGMTNSSMSVNYNRGDANGDKKIDSKDSVCILNALNNNMVNAVSIDWLNHGHLSEWFPNITTAEAADANADGFVKKNDSDLILDAYSKMISNTYKGNVGKTYSVIIK